jgi:hypothetical protein
MQTGLVPENSIRPGHKDEKRQLLAAQYFVSNPLPLNILPGKVAPRLANLKKPEILPA